MVFVENIVLEWCEQFVVIVVVFVVEQMSVIGSFELLLNGLQIVLEGKFDVVQDQGQVDDLFVSFGF